MDRPFPTKVFDPSILEPHIEREEKDKEEIILLWTEHHLLLLGPELVTQLDRLDSKDVSQSLKTVSANLVDAFNNTLLPPFVFTRGHDRNDKRPICMLPDDFNKLADWAHELNTIRVRLHKFKDENSVDLKPHIAQNTRLGREIKKQLTKRFMEICAEKYMKAAESFPDLVGSILQNAWRKGEEPIDVGGVEQLSTTPP